MLPLCGQTIVFLPGIDGTGISFEPFAEILPRDVASIIIRYPTDRLLSFEETVQCARDQVSSDLKDVIVLAESFSGPVAIQLVGSGHIKAKCLILCSTFARSPRPYLLTLLRYLPVAAFLRLPFPRLIFKHMVEGGDGTVDLFITLWKRVNAQVPAKVLVHRLKVMNQVDVRAWLPKLTLPCLYLQAASDRSVPATAVMDFTEAVPDLTVVRIRGPHFILQAQPRASLAAITDFICRIGQPDKFDRNS